VGMCKDDGIYTLDLFPQHLLAEVRTRIDYKTLITDLDVNRSTQPFVAVIERPAYFACAANHWHTL